ncbi:MAG: hypothetical protein COU31_00810 [Candidatus Magasanikbacteria bacterium CG10_big_fil_rev_8_21_14_0_10_40_10]|uniref:Cell shape-determining protein MreC n=1 Tax=Candidatus Magasanikbacteria bacterium CG10_big_fil_rev_8_21_14_0_10_40_10 TaxID=1974648 RepID=A0A2M6W4Y3_9BACT|nr:MAG: hypothetical protein COU31_00810 [Candidatus Magasanikbacteria bacterium CG10_big_fil_rev_8_21_14_0_10_40_10]
MTLISGKKKLLVLGVIILLIFFHYAGLIKWLEKPLQTAILRATSPVYKLGTKWQAYIEKNKDQQTLSQIQAQNLSQNIQLQALKAQNEVLTDENEQLKKLANFSQTNKYKIISAKVVGKNINNTEKTVIISTPDVSQLKSGLAVVVENGILIGKIDKLTADGAFVRLINDNQSKIAAIILNKDRSTGIVEGGFGLSVHMTLIPRNEVIVVGEQVVSSGLEPQIPRGLLIGNIAIFENEAFAPFAQAVVVPSVDLDKITMVGVLIP